METNRANLAGEPIGSAHSGPACSLVLAGLALFWGVVVLGLVLAVRSCNASSSPAATEVSR